MLRAGDPRVCPLIDRPQPSLKMSPFASNCLVEEGQVSNNILPTGHLFLKEVPQKLMERVDQDFPATTCLSWRLSAPFWNEEVRSDNKVHYAIEWSCTRALPPRGEA
jgi:hypothetical protein